MKRIKILLVALLMMFGICLVAGCSEETAKQSESYTSKAEQGSKGSKDDISNDSISETEQDSINSESDTLPERFSEEGIQTSREGQKEESSRIIEDGVYTAPEDVAEYIHTFNKLPSNFIRKKEAEQLGWDSSKGNLQEVAEGMSIGGDRFGNREGLLPDADGRKWYECDVNDKGGYRGAERIVFSNDGLIFYTGDHYKSFIQLY